MLVNWSNTVTHLLAEPFEAVYEGLTAEEAANRLGCKPGLIYKLCAAGRLGHLRVGFGRGRIVIEDRHLEDYRRSVEVLPLTLPRAEPDRPRAVRDYVGEWERRRKAGGR